jgi:hypothetical protein
MNITNQKNKLVTVPMSDVLIKSFFDGKANIKTLEEIANLTSLEEVMGDYDHCIIYMHTDPVNNFGHWVCLFVNSNKLYYFDSYGDKPLEYLNVMRNNGIELNGQNFNLISLITQSKYKNSFFWNPTEFQSNDKSNTIATCGRYVTQICILNKIYKRKGLKFDLTKYNSLMENWKRTLKLGASPSFDKVTTFFINQL